MIQVKEVTHQYTHENGMIVTFELSDGSAIAAYAHVSVTEATKLAVNALLERHVPDRRV